VKYNIENKVELMAFLRLLGMDKDNQIQESDYNFDLRSIEDFYNSLPAFDDKYKRRRKKRRIGRIRRCNGRIVKRRDVVTFSDKTIEKIQNRQDESLSDSVHNERMRRGLKHVSSSFTNDENKAFEKFKDILDNQL